MKRSSPFADGLGPAFVYFAFMAGAWLAEHVPIRLGNWVAKAGGALAFRLARRKREVARKNLARVVGLGPHLDEILEKAFESYARYWLETFRLGRYSKAQLLEMVECDSLEVIEKGLAEGRGVVIVTAHFGFYDLGVAWIGAMGYPLGTVAEVLRPRALFEWFAKTREARGMSVIAAKPREEARAKMLDIVNMGRGVALLADRDLGRRGVWVSLFNEKTTAPVGPPLLVAKTRPVLMTGALYQIGENRYRMDFEPVSYELSGDDERENVERVAQTIAEAVEMIVRKAPEQWHLFSTNWPADEPHLPPRGSQA